MTDSTVSPTQRRFEPWVGSAYRDGFGGLRLLIVGESHYGTAEQNGDREATRRCVHNFALGTWKGSPFFANVQSLFVDLLPGVAAPRSPDQRLAFWQQVSFYNYVQELMSGPGVPPSTAAWSRGVTPFGAVVRELEPHCVLFACKRLYANTKANFESAPLLELDGSSRHAVFIPTAERRALGSYILHPSYRGYRKQAPWVGALLLRAQGVASPEPASPAG